MLFSRFCMKIKEVITHIENFAPKGASWKDDNVGLQVGNPENELTNIFLCLEITPDALYEALKQNCNFIFTHHPFFFIPPKRLNFADDEKSQILEKLVKENITLYSAHTNFDFTKHGVSYELAKILNLKNIKFLEYRDSNQYKLVTFVPEENVNTVSEAVFNAGGGIIGEYGRCSYRLNGEGTFEGSEHSNPAVGNKQNFEKVSETRIEFLVDEWKLKSAVKAMVNAHPYEEPAYDIYVLKNKNVNYGMGAIGELEEEISVTDFLRNVCFSLQTDFVRYTNPAKETVKRVAVCGGSGSGLLNKAISMGADAFVTADVKYHTFQDGENKILFVDAGHYETEIHSLNVIARELENIIPKETKVYKYSGTTNPVKFFSIKE